MVASSPLFRIAPTPSGWLHQGNLWNFLLIKHLSIHLKGQILLRIDDLDNSRFRAGYLENIFDILDLLHIDYIGPSGPTEFYDSWSQHHRMALYERAIQALASKNALRASSLSRKQLQEGHTQSTATSHSEKSYWYLSEALNAHVIAVQDQVQGKMEVPVHLSMPQIVIRKKDGLPSYQLASVVDDFHFKVTHIVRGEDLLPSTAAQHLLAAHLREEAWRPWWVHHPLLVDENGNKLSKSAGKSTHAPAWTHRDLNLIESSVCQYLELNFTKLHA